MRLFALTGKKRQRERKREQKRDGHPLNPFRICTQQHAAANGKHNSDVDAGGAITPKAAEFSAVAKPVEIILFAVRLNTI